ncbi:MAG: MoxR family ATPase, partial [Bacteroidota bacterium]
ANIILADEINRTPPKTQAALLEAMQEHKVTAAGVTHILDEPFFVLATQNPIEQEGTYPLPEAQLDRFMFNLWLDYPKFNEEIKIIKSTTSDYTPLLNKVVTAEQLIAFQKLIKRVPVADNVIEYAVKVVESTRPNNNKNEFVKERVAWGAGPRASQYLILASKTKAVMDGRFTPSIDDVKSFLQPVLRHRIIPNFSADAEGITSVDIINRLAQL